MKPSLLLRITAGLLVIFALGHTVGLFGTPSRGEEELALFKAMEAYRFDIMGFSRTHWDFYFGFSLFLSLNVLLLIALVWQLAGLAASDPGRARSLVTSLFVAHVAFAILCWTYFFLAPAVIATAAALCLGLALVSLRKPARVQENHS